MRKSLDREFIHVNSSRPWCYGTVVPAPLRTGCVVKRAEGDMFGKETSFQDLKLNADDIEVCFDVTVLLAMSYMSDTNADDGLRSRIPRLRPTPVPFQINTRRTRYSEGGGTRQQPASAIPVAALISRSPNGRLQIQLPDTATAQARVQPPDNNMANVQDLVNAIALLTTQFRDQQAQQNTNSAAVQLQLQQALTATNDLVTALAGAAGGGGGVGGGGGGGGGGGFGAVRVVQTNRQMNSLPECKLGKSLLNPFSPKSTDQNEQQADDFYSDDEESNIDTIADTEPPFPDEFSFEETRVAFSRKGKSALNAPRPVRNLVGDSTAGLGLHRLFRQLKQRLLTRIISISLTQPSRRTRTTTSAVLSPTLTPNPTRVTRTLKHALTQNCKG
ncbi:hypothetical protein DAPPUDRAFT_116861 [Daphnia pulex]|uniref:Uncharacterized protein n=1 Tax=Daphnia pulex TaxID=6669 RepID=E9HQS6_DAPPU|nr:hypothetical protein DAPPUDRAFT_116861 [Daphnia pulex]|eukprot:EFX65906.1 hypothetical protein DAPPUDRAFT_116861 [Daphnia pulex]